MIIKTHFRKKINLKIIFFGARYDCIVNGNICQGIINFKLEFLVEIMDSYVCDDSRNHENEGNLEQKSVQEKERTAKTKYL